jgi:hypothetical protein
LQPLAADFLYRFFQLVFHNERPDELRRMAQEMAREGMAMLARTSQPARPHLEKIA